MLALDPESALSPALRALYDRRERTHRAVGFARRPRERWGYWGGMGERLPLPSRAAGGRWHPDRRVRRGGIGLGRVRVVGGLALWGPRSVGAGLARAGLTGPQGLRLAEELAQRVPARWEWPRAAYEGALPTRGPGRRGGGLAALTDDVQEWLAEADGLVDVDAVRGSWQESLAAADWDGRTVLSHGDLIPGNLLVQGDRLSAVIDWGGAGAGDPALDLIPAWDVLDGQAAARFREAVAAEDDSWLRARGYSLQQAVAGVVDYTPRRHPLADVMRRALEAILRDG